jgi:hypothetical protein
MHTNKELVSDFLYHERIVSELPSVLFCIRRYCFRFFSGVFLKGKDGGFLFIE